MGNNLFFLSNDTAIEMNESRYEREDDLQRLIENNPQLILRDKSADENQLMLIAREYTFREEDDSSNAFSLDHLFVDQRGTPVLVEVKRSTDTRIRREVVGQMMDYASRASSWNVNELRALFKENNPAGEVLEAYDTDEFWEQVETCLKADRMKLVFAADSIPNSLKTSIEFMNRSMKDIEVYGVEIRQYKTTNATLLASSVIGEPPLKQTQTVSRSSTEWNTEKFSAFLMERGKGNLILIVQNLMEYADRLGIPYVFGRGAQNPTLMFKFKNHQLFTIMGWSKKAAGDLCTVEFCIRDLLTFKPGKDWGADRLRDLFSDLPGKKDAERSGLIWNSKDYLYIELSAMLDEENLQYLKEAIRTMYDAIGQDEREILSSPSTI